MHFVRVNIEKKIYKILVILAAIRCIDTIRGRTQEKIRGPQTQSCGQN